MALVVTTAATAADWRDATLEVVRKEVVEAMFAQSGALWISVAPDGTPRDGLAQYFCLVMLDAGKPPHEFILVRIWDAMAMARGDMVEIGRTECYQPKS